MINKVYLLGFLGQAPEFKRTKGGQRYARLSLATSKSWRDKASGERRKRTDWHRIVVWSEPLIEVVEKYCAKGSRVWVEGELSQRQWTDDKGATHYVAEILIQPFTGVITLMDSKKGERVPEPEGEDVYGDVTEMERCYA